MSGRPRILRRAPSLAAGLALILLGLILLGGAQAREVAVDHPAPPAFATESWEPARLLTWAHPGKDGLFHLPLGWLENGVPARTGPDAGTDVLLPVADTPYLVRPDIDGIGSKVACRHITVERNAGFAAGYRNSQNITVTGNVRVHAGGRLNNVRISGTRHTSVRFDGFDFRQGDFRCGQPRNPQSWAPNALSWKFDVVKLAGGSVTFLGNIGIVDEFLVHSGRVVIGEDSEVRFGKTTTGAMEIFDGAIVELREGAVLGPFAGQMAREARGNVRVLRGGALRGGSPDHPLSRDAFLLLGCPGRPPSRPRIRSQDIRDPVGLATVLLAGQDPVSRALVEAYPDLASDRTRTLVDRFDETHTRALTQALSLGLQRAAQVVSLSKDEILAELPLTPEQLGALRDPAPRDRAPVNLRIVRAAYPSYLVAESNADGLHLTRGSRLDVFTVDPERARLVITSITDPISHANGATSPQLEEPAVGPDYGIELDLAGDISPRGLAVDFARARGIGLPDIGAWRGWEGFSFGDHCAPGDREVLFRELPPAAPWEGDIERNVTAHQSMDKYLFVPTFTPAVGAYAPQESVVVQMAIRSKHAEIRFTRDGSVPDATAELYRRPVPLDRTQTLTAAAFRDGERAGELGHPLFASAHFVIEAPVAAVTLAGPRPGVDWTLVDQEGDRMATGRGDSLNWKDLELPRPGKDTRIEFRGYVRVPATGGWTFTTNHLGSRVEVAGRTLIDTFSDEASLRSSMVLEAGMHSLLVEVQPGRGGGRNPLRYGDQQLRLTWQSTQQTQQPIPGSALFRGSGDDDGDR